MSKITLSGNASGTGTLTIAAPNTNTDYTLTLPTSTGTVLTDSNSSQAGTFSTLTVNSNNISADNSLGFRNRIINGDMRIDQRNAGASITPTSTAYSVDRWQATVNVSSKASFDQTTTAPTGFTNSMLITSLSAYSVAAGDIVTFRQQIEGFNIADLGWGAASAKTVTASFLVRSSLTGTFGGSVKNGDSSRSYPFTYTISAANTWETKTVTIAGDTSGTWATDNTSGLILSFGIGVGSTTSGTAGAWASANYNSATGATSVIGTNGATFYITGVQLEVGSVATPFERRPYGTELNLCLRYFRKTLGTTNTEPTLYAWGNNSQVIGQSWVYPTPMRASPTVTTEGTLAIEGASGATIAANETSYLLYVSASSATAGRITYQPNASYKISFSAEL